MCSPVFWKFVGFVCFCLSHLDVSPLGAEDSLIRSAVELHFFMWLRDVPTPCTVRTSFPNPCAVAPPLSSVQGVSKCQSFRGSFCRPLGETLPTEPPEGSRPVLLSSWRRVWTPVCVPVTPRDEPGSAQLLASTASGTGSRSTGKGAPLFFTLVVTPCAVFLDAPEGQLL